MAQAERVLALKASVEALNQQFSQWVAAQVSDHPSKLLTAGVSDYLRHSAKLRAAYADVLTEDSEDLRGGSPGGDPKKRSSYAPLLSLTPLCHTKTVHFIRHGEGYHNIGLANPDARLTPKGWQQAVALRKHMLKFEVTRGVQLVIMSPLMRALETAAGVMGDGANHNSGTAVLMLGQQEVKNTQATQEAMYARPGLRYAAHELCRERMGPSPCDSRRPRSEAAAVFPGVDFSLIVDDADTLWRPGYAEDEAAVATRGRQFLQYLMSLEESNVAVVTHSAFLWFTLALFGNDYAPSARDKLQRWYENCEMRTLVLSDGGGVGVLDETHFRGGHAAAEPQQALLDEPVAGR